MIKDFQINKDLLASNLRQYFLPVLLKKLEDHISFLKHVENLYGNAIGFEKEPLIFRQSHEAAEKSALLNKLIRYKKDLNALVEAYLQNSEKQDFDQLFPDYVRVTDEFLATIPKYIVLPQENDHFSSRKEDKALIRLAKGCKKAFYQIAKTPERSLNLFRKAFHKKHKPVRPWMRKVHLRNIATFYLREQLDLQLKKTLDDIHRLICTTTLNAWSMDESVNAMSGYWFHPETEQDLADISVKKLNETIGRIRDEMKRLQPDLLAMLNNTYGDLETDLHKAGTIELPNLSFNRFRIRHKHLKLNRTVLNAERGWGFTYKGLFDDWGIDNELYQLMFTSLEGYYRMLDDMRRQLEKGVYPWLESARRFLSESRQKIEVLNNTDDLLETIAKERAVVRSELSGKMLPELGEMLMNLDFQALPEKLMKSLQEHVGRISHQRAISRTNDYTKPFRSGYLSYVSPSDLIGFECLPRLMKNAVQTGSKLASRLKSLQNTVFEVGQIADFNLESALDYARTNRTQDNPGRIAVEGMDRALERTEQIRQHFDALFDVMEKDFLAGVKAFNDDLEKFTDNNNIIEIRIRIIRAKAAKRMKVLRQKLVHVIIQQFPAILQWIKSIYSNVKGRLGRVSKKYGFAVEKEIISVDLAELLTETQQAVERLPYVYQRLFKIDALTDERFFVGRLPELQELRSAFERWQKNQYMPTLVVGEKGDGASSLINIFIGDIEKDIKVVRLKADLTLCTEIELVDFLNHKMQRNFSQIDEWVGFLNENGKTIVVLEDCQRLYLKKVNGFEALVKLNDLIHKTGRIIFWILTFTEYTFVYLNRTLLLSEHYRNIIRLGEFSDQTMAEIIDQRHRVSGFNIAYDPSPSDLVQKKYKSASLNERQDFLRSAFFSDLARIAKSNIRIALTYWIMSIREIRDNTLLIKSLKDLKLSFLDSLSSTKLFVLGALILHETLQEEDFGTVLNMNEAHASRVLQSLFEDGILLREHTYYMINPVLYRQVTDILKNKNILH